jgi:hypothetical protein
MRANSFTFTFAAVMAKLKYSFNEYIGLPFLILLCILYCILEPSAYWLVPIVLAKAGFKPAWASFQIFVVENRLKGICKRHKLDLKTNDIDFGAALNDTRFDKNNYGLIPTM